MSESDDEKARQDRLHRSIADAREGVMAAERSQNSTVSTVGGATADLTTEELLERSIRSRVDREVSRARVATQASERGVSGISPRERELLHLLIEECAELQQIATKTLRHGWGSYNPSGSPRLSNGSMMQHEYIDLTTVLGQLLASGRLDPVGPFETHRCWQRKLRWLHEQGSSDE